MFSDNVKSNCHAELDSASVPCRELSVSPVRFRVKPGMTLKEIPSLQASAGCVAIQVPEAHPREVEHDFLTPNQLETGLTAGGLPRSRWSLAMTPTESVLCLVNRLSVKKCAFTMAARLSRFHNVLVGLRSAFTMAEILLSLTIIGVVAAITLPSLTGNINERTWNTQRKALYARFSQAVPLINSLNGYANAETFVTGALGSVLKINNICDKDHLSDCGLSSVYTALDGSKNSLPKTLSELNPALTSVNHCDSMNALFSYSQADTDAAAFETANGESIVVYYNPTCAPNMQETGRIYVQSKICAHFVYDLNGTKGPNTIGKDMGFMSAIYPTDSIVVAPIPHSQDAATSIIYDDAAGACTKQDSEYRVPSVYELMSMFASRYMIGGNFSSANGYQPSTLVSTGKELFVYRLALAYGSLDLTAKNRYSYALRCIKR